MGLFPARRSITAAPSGLSLAAAAACASLALGLAGCPEANPAADAGAMPDGGVLAPDATAEVPPPLQLEVRYQAPDGGMALIEPTAGGDVRPVIEPTSQLQVSTSVGLQNYRIRLFDAEVDRVMVSDDLMEEPGDRVLYRIQLPAPLKAGHRYALVVDAQTGSAIADSAGRLYPDQRLEFQIAGAREPDSPAPKKIKQVKRLTKPSTRRRR